MIESAREIELPAGTRSRRPESLSSGWGYCGTVDAIDFQTNGDAILRGYRLWGVTSGSTTFQVTIGLYRGSSTIAEKTGSYNTRSTGKTFEVQFLQEISIRAGLLYSATAKITTSASSFAHTLTACQELHVLASSKDSNSSGVGSGQIPALIFRFLRC
ncbi:BTB/POZ domain-containing protein 6-like [Orbicella faveolata]|uniref:BTB/POZ domain-containing protein 6-like n=1 Tax=Orbicella faveolata TaxID=48498 RepID=UPI0009E1A9E8|nr:BTB/POZ domain-containing protein 6-like [Orbicella faveolata]